MELLFSFCVAIYMYVQRRTVNLILITIHSPMQIHLSLATVNKAALYLGVEITCCFRALCGAMWLAWLRFRDFYS